MLVAAPAGEAVRCGVLSIEAVFKEMTLIRQRSDRLMADRQAAKQEIEEKEKAFGEVKNELMILGPDHRRRAEMEERVAVEEVRLKLFTERRVRVLQQLEADLMKQSYADMKRLLKEFAQEKGYTLIFIRPNPDLKSEKLQELRLEISMQPVVYSADHHDITADFITFANARGETAPPAPPAPPVTPSAPPVDPAPGFEKRPSPPEGP
jgi:Skp family chaperone for outer membrane proteins